MKTKVAIIGGSGFENPDFFSLKEEVILETPYGFPNSSLLRGEIAGREVVMLSRHGRNHEVPPGQVNNRANIYALKETGCTHILATTACGSLREEIGRGDLVVPDQFIDFTKHRVNTFYDHFENGDLKHVSMANPFDEKLRKLFVERAIQLGFPCHDGGTIVTIEGPRFSTRAESRMFRQLGADIINMSIAPEAALAREAGIPYGVIAMSTDYDSWKDDELPVAWEEVLKVFRENVHKVRALLLDMIPRI